MIATVDVNVQLTVSTEMSILSEQPWTIMYKIEKWLDYTTKVTLVGRRQAVNEAGYLVLQDLFWVRKHK